MTDPVSPVVILSTADFATDVWTNKQHLAVGLARHTHVTYIESLGLRAPRLRGSDVSRMARRLRRAPAKNGYQQVPETMDVVRPLVVPFHGNRMARAINQHRMDVLPLAHLPESVLWTFSPITYGLERRAMAVIYHSVDLLHTQPNMPADALLSAERQLVARADRVLASSQGVWAHLQGFGRSDVELWENVADTDLFGSIHNKRDARAIFAGNLTPNKVDAEAILSIADAGINTVIAGPISIDGSGMSEPLRAVLEHPRVMYLGTLSPARLADAFSRSMVGIIPYRLNSYTAGVFPLKVYEYLAAGLQVVSTPLPSIIDHASGDLTLANPDDFAAAVADTIKTFSEVDAAGRSERASAHSWNSRVLQATQLLHELTALRLATVQR